MSGAVAAFVAAAAALVLAAAAFVVGRDGWPGSQLIELMGLVALICIAPFAVALAAGRRRDILATQDPSPQIAGASAEATPAARDAARMALENERLETELHSTLSELRASRLRILSAADRERRRIERDLHDGAQQRLVALGIQLELAAELAEADPGRVARRLRELGARRGRGGRRGARARSGARPADARRTRGLADALREAAATSPLIARVQAARSWGATRPSSRARSTSAASRRFRTPQSTPTGPAS